MSRFPMVRPSAPRALFPLAALLLLVAPVSADVVVVNPGGGNGSSQLQTRINNASPGDVILLEAGSYELPVGSFVLDKAVCIFPAEGVDQVVSSGFLIRDIPAVGTVVLRGLVVQNEQIEIEDCLGDVWIEDCEIQGRPGINFAPGSTPGTPAVEATNSVSVTIVRSTLTGGRGANAVNVFGMPLGASDGGAAVESSQSRVSIHDSILLGGDGGIDSVLGSVDLAGGDGGAGLDATGELVVAVGGSATGGAAGASFGTGPTATGGSGVHLEGGATAWLRDIARVAGAAGDLPNSQSNQPGVPVSTPGPGNTVLTLGAPARSLVLDAVLPENGVAQMTVRGQPGDFVYLVFSLGGGFKAMFPRQGVLAMDLNTFFGPVPLFALPASGELTLPLVVPALPEPVAGGMVTWQAVFDAGTGQALIGAPTATAWVDESF